MFTLKFKAGKETHNVSCQSFTDFTDTWGVTHITAYQGLSQVGGVCYKVCTKETYSNLPVPDRKAMHLDDYYTECYVENSAGKTINKF